MAENVEYRSEEYAAELDIMKQAQLFTRDELRSIQAKRTSYEYVVERGEKRKEDYLLYIQHEIDVLKIIGERKNMSPLRDQLNGLTDRLVQRISKLFNQAVLRFAGDERLLISYINFCKQMHLHNNASVILSQMLVLHVNQPHLWHLAALWEYEEMHSVENARKIYVRGLRFHPTNEKLYLEAFKFELSNAQILRKKVKKEHSANKCNIPTDQNSDDILYDSQESDFKETIEESECINLVLNGHLAKIIFASAVKHVPEVSLISQFLNISQEYDFAKEVQLKILDCLRNDFKDDELTWDILAQYELGVDFSGNFIKGNSEDSKNLRHRIELCCSVYKSAVNHIPTVRMWSYYIETLLSLAKEESILTVFKTKLLKKAFEDAHEAGLLHEKYYSLWLPILQGTEKLEKIDFILNAVTSRFPNSCNLWQICLHFHISHSNEKKINTVFKKAINSLQSDSDSLLLWKILLNHYQSSDASKVYPLFENALSRGGVVAQAFKPLYIEWAACSEGISGARKVYDCNCRLHPFSLDMHIKMINLETQQAKIKMDRIRKCYNCACEQFGTENFKIWLEYIKFEHEKGDINNINNIYHRALMVLKPADVDSFITEFQLMKTIL